MLIRTSIAQPRGHLNFNQQFHLPFYSWRCTKQEPKDNRFKTDGSPLRNVHNMRFLRGKPSKKIYEIDYLCEAQLSVLITAFDQRVWTGYCFVDVYYQFEGRRQAAQDYCKVDADADTLQRDPFTSGECDSDNPILDPGQYFLTSLDAQLRVFRNEWTDTVHHMKSRVKDYVFLYIQNALERPC